MKFVAVVFHDANSITTYQYSTLQEMHDAVGGDLPSDWNDSNSVLFFEMEFWDDSVVGVLQRSTIKNTWTHHDMNRAIYG